MRLEEFVQQPKFVCEQKAVINQAKSTCHLYVMD